MDNKELQRLEKELGITRKENTREQIQAAYALNLCAVSVSQIIDYNDINILDQEYDAILNNLNLENIPKDEALLDILEHVLETIVFFKIQDEEKKIAEKEYQNKIKNAIWQAMPNPGALVYAGLQRGVVGAITSLAATVGTAYMSYRKSKSDAAQEHEKKEWELRRTALEQFQMLQQQLFETSWRLADKYNFSDELRLNVKQIKQFNSILTDPDEVRKYERLRSVQHKFGAYPPYWYYLGNTANSIALSNMYGLDDEDREKYRSDARNCFEYFTMINEYHLLREDTITAGCYLEYAGLLDPVADKEKIRELIGKAANMAGNSLDILQLCATAYMSNGNIQDAERLLRQLVNEQYNEVTNAQLLSKHQISDGKEKEKLDFGEGEMTYHHFYLAIPVTVHTDMIGDVDWYYRMEIFVHGYGEDGIFKKSRYVRCSGEPTWVEELQETFDEWETEMQNGFDEWEVEMQNSLDKWEAEMQNSLDEWKNETQKDMDEYFDNYDWSTVE